jgi:chemotaxis protein MotB
MRKKKPPEHVNHERWLVSYADFITLLFAFFVVMFAVSQVDTKRVGRFTEAFSKAVGVNVLPLSGDSLIEKASLPNDEELRTDAPAPGTPLDTLRTALDEIARKQGDLRGLQVIRRRNELILRLPEGVLFDVGQAEVRSGSVGTLKAIAPELASRHVEVRIEGHTDNRPTRGGRFASNWALSTARAMAVMTRLVSEGMPENRISVAGYGEFRPLAPNDTEEGRKQNRRVDLVVTAIAEETPVP